MDLNLIGPIHGATGQPENEGDQILRVDGGDGKSLPAKG